MTFMRAIPVRNSLLAASALALLSACGPAGQGNGSGAPETTPPPPQATTVGGPTVEPSPLSAAPAPEIPHGPPGELLSRTVADFVDGYAPQAGVVAAGMRFPLHRGPAFANSQAFGPGGSGVRYRQADGQRILYPPVGGRESDAANFDYPWRDNFCEVRNKKNGFCPAGEGHQGQDVRAASRDIGKYCIVAPERAKVMGIGSTNLVHLYGLESGLGFSLMHMDAKAGLMPGVEKGAILERGAPIARVANIMGDCPATRSDCTTTHLHFEIWTGAYQAVTNRGERPHSPYTSLIEAYRDLIAENPDQFAPGADPDAPSPCDGL